MVDAGRVASVPMIAWWRRRRLGCDSRSTIPGLTSLRSAARAAIVMPAVFAFADKVIKDAHVATFAAFGSFAMLVLVEFGGPVRSRLIAYVALACIGVANITLGTLCSRDALLAAGAMAVVGFAILFSGAINGYFAAASSAALLTFILSVTIRAPLSALGGRLEGWALAATAGICAQMLLLPLPAQASLLGGVKRACLALAGLAETALAGDDEAIGDDAREARRAEDDLRRRFRATPNKPTGPAGPQAALSSLVDELGWLLSFLAPTEQAPGLEICPEENAEAVAAVVAALRIAAARMDGADEQPDFARLETTRQALAQALVRRIPDLPVDPDDQALAAALEPAFRIRTLSYGAEAVAVDALAVSGAPVSEPADVARCWHPRRSGGVRPFKSPSSSPSSR